MHALTARLSIGLGLLLVLSLVPSAAAQVDPPEGFAAHFHRDDTTVVVIEDPLPHLRTLLNSQALRRAFNDGPLGQLMRKADDGIAPDPAAWWQWVNTNRRWVPQQVAIGQSDAGVGDWDHLLRIVALNELLHNASLGDPNDVKLQADAKVLRQALSEELTQFRVPRMRVYVRFRDAEDAGALLELVKLQVDDLAPEDLPPGLTFEQKNTSMTGRFSLADNLAAQGLDLREALVDMGMVDLNDPPAVVAKAVEAVGKFKAEATLELVGTGLLLTVGPTNAGGPAGLPAAFLNLPEAVGKRDDQTLFWGRWSAIRLKSAAAAWLNLHEKWKASAAYRVAAEDPATGESMLDMLHDVAIRLRKLADNGSMRIWHDAKASGLRLAMVEEPKANGVDLAGSTPAKMLPADAEGLTVSTDTSLGEVISDTLMQVEERLATRSLRESIAGDGAGGAEALELGYYAHFAALRELVHRAALERYEPGYAAIVGTQGKVSRIEASFELQTRPQRLSGRDLPTPELALIGKPRGGEAAARAHLEKVYGALLGGIRSGSRAEALANEPVPPVDAKAVLVDLGLGVPSWGFDGRTVTRVSGEAKLRISVEGDLQPHFFFVDGWIVLSTSPRLSKNILAAHSGKGKRLMLPEEEEAALIAIGRYSGDTLGTTLEHLKAWYTAMLASAGDEVDAAEQGRVTIVLDAMAVVSRMLGKVEWTTIQPANERRHITEGVVIFAAD